jgi:hypothetical protein
MANHIKIPTEKQHKELIDQLNSVKRIQTLPNYLKVNLDEWVAMRLDTEDYKMDISTEFVLSFSNGTDTYEIHLDSGGAIKQVYNVI